MTNKIFKTLLALVVLSASGLNGCDTSGERTKSEDSNNSWTVGEVGLVRENELYLNFKNTEEALKNYKLSDVVLFKMFSQNHLQSAHAKITTSCFKENTAMTPYSFSENLRETYGLFELLPAEIIFALHETKDLPFICGFDITVRNVSGDTHRFELPAAPILNSPIDDPLLVFKGYQNISSNLDETFEVSKSDWPSYFLPPLSLENESYEFICTHQHGQVAYSPRQQGSPVGFTQFKSQNENEQKFSDILSSQYCRVFLRQPIGRIIKMTNLFVIKPAATLPLITTTHTDPIIKIEFWTKNVNVAAYRIDNTSAKPITVGFDSAQINQIEFQMHLTGHGRSHHGSIVIFPLKMEVGGVATVAVNNQLRFTIPPGQSASISFSLFLRHIQCEAYNIVGTYYRWFNRKGLELKIFDDINGPADQLNELAKIEIEPPLVRYIQLIEPPRSEYPRIKIPSKPTDPPLTLDDVGGVCRIL